MAYLRVVTVFTGLLVLCKGAAIEGNPNDEVVYYPFSGDGLRAQISKSWQNFTASGEPINKEDYPFLADIMLYPDEFTSFCGGVIIDQYHVLTTASCFDTIDLRTHILYVLTEDKQTVPVEHVYQYPCYDKASNEYYHDIAIIKMKQPFEYNDLVNEVELPEYDQVAENLVDPVAISWYQEIIKSDVNVIDLQECSKYFDVSSHQLCIRGRSTCIDFAAGLPVVETDASGKHVLTGLGSYIGEECNNAPAVYTRLAKYVNWIKQVMNDVRANYVC